MTTGVLNNSLTCATIEQITVPLAQYTELLHRVERLERIILKQREAAIMEFSAVEDAFGIARTKEKRVR